MNRITNAYEHALQVVYHSIESRGIRVDLKVREESLAVVRAELARQLAIASNLWSCKVFIGAENNPVEQKDGPFSGAVNLNATQGKYKLLTKLKDLGYDVPKISKKNEEGEYESKESTEELVLRKILQNNQFNYPGGDPAIKAILKVRELAKLQSTYLCCRLFKREGSSYFLCNYNVAGTVTGRRSSRRHTLGFGNNAQNFPSHSDVAELARKTLIAREGNVLLFCDQVSAEDWPVSALSENYNSLSELGSGVDRHTKLASFLFNIPVSTRTYEEWKDSMERYLGKKTRHASNYDERATMMSDSLIKEGFYYTIPQCQALLDRMGQIDPNVKNVFHRYVRETVSKTRVLTTPFGRERQFLNARPGENNNSVFKEAYAYIPQSVVGDNTGFAVLNLESSTASGERAIIQEGHDSLVQDINDDENVVYKYVLRTIAAFKRRIRFHNGIELEIPIEFQVGYDFETVVKIKQLSLDGVREALKTLRAKRDVKQAQAVVV